MRPPAQYAFVSPDGVVYIGHNIRQFAARHNLCPANMQHVHLGERKHHKGWTVCRSGALLNIDKD